VRIMMTKAARAACQIAGRPVESLVREHLSHAPGEPDGPMALRARAGTTTMSSYRLSFDIYVSHDEGDDLVVVVARPAADDGQLRTRHLDSLCPLGLDDEGEC
jgi:hypothetical protein